MDSLWRSIRPYLSRTVRYLHISYLETKSEYEDTYLGILWIPFSTLIFTGMLALVFRHSDALPPSSFFLYVLSGFVLWNFISDSIGGSTNIIQKRLEFALHNNLSLGGLFLKILVDRLFEFGINLSVLVLAMLFLSPSNFGANILLFPPFLLLISIMSLSVSYLVNLVTILYPDSGNLTKTAMRFLFFASPVFWLEESKAGLLHLLATINPVSYFLSLAREVFGVEPLSAQVWMIGGSITLASAICAGLAFRYSQHFVRNIQ
ncbi:MAG: ABC transporter permease [Devosia nanyangense]|uniref:ABC transporter permease n=1 Tax=Devosia nanyangense TaxID=1228055 RepID=A0A933L209_9HYPH|nr:ABC transporter permease [Devosia nanyangense]